MTLIHPKLQQIIPIFLHQCFESGIFVSLTEVNRPIELQARYFLEDKSRTMKSKHLIFELSNDLKIQIESSLLFHKDMDSQAQEAGMSEIFYSIEPQLDALPQIGAKAFDIVGMIPNGDERKILYLRNRLEICRDYQSQHYWGMTYLTCGWSPWFEEPEDSSYYQDWLAIYGKMGIIGESLGLEWGGRWTDPWDIYHFQLKG